MRSLRGSGLYRHDAAHRGWREDARAIGVAARGNIEVTVNGQSVGLNPFTAQMLSGGIKGMLGALKGMVPGGEVIIRMKG